MTFRVAELIVASRFPPLSVRVSRKALISELAFMVTIEVVLATCISTFSRWVRVVEFRNRLDLLVVAWALANVLDLCLCVRLLANLYVPVRPAHRASLTTCLPTLLSAWVFGGRTDVRVQVTVVVSCGVVQCLWIPVMTRYTLLFILTLCG